MQIESTHVCSALWRIRVDIMTNLTSSYFLNYVVYMCRAKNHKILWMHSCVTSKNVKWCHLIWPTLYVITIPQRHGQTDGQTDDLP